jgi:molybdopterin-guanine dinucleotide biosynthesis protein A
MNDPGPVRAAAVVLAGGQSRRMGSAKALLPFAGEILIARVLRRLEPITVEQVVVAAPGQDLPPLPALIVRDPQPHRGPVAGLAVGLAAAGAPRAFVTSCDAPFLNPDLVSWMISESVSWDIVVPEWEGRLNPLHAVYATALAADYRRQLEEDRLRPVDLYPHVRLRVVSPDEIRRFDPKGRSLTNLNSPADYLRALAEAAAELA